MRQKSFSEKDEQLVEFSKKMEEDIAAMRAKLEKKFDQKLIAQGKMISDQEAKMTHRILL